MVYLDKDKTKHKIIASFKYGKVSPLWVLIFFASIGLTTITAGTIYIVIKYKKTSDYNYIVLGAFAIVVLIAVSLIEMRNQILNRSFTKKCLCDAVFLTVKVYGYSSRREGFSIASRTGYSIYLDFHFDGKRIIKKSKFHPIFDTYTEGFINILYSEKYDEVLLLE